MTEKNVLSQEEIDALLQSVDESSEGEAQKAETKEAVGNAKSPHKKTTIGKRISGSDPSLMPEESEVKTLNFSAQERIVKGKLPVLERIYDRAVRSFASDIYQLTAKDFEITQDQLLIIKHREFMESLPNPILMCIYKFKPLNGKGIIMFDSTFVYDLVDYYFGGSTQFLAQKDRTDFTATELRVMEVVTTKLVADLILAWKPIIQLDITKFSEETNPQLVNIAEPEEMLLVVRFSLNFGKETGDFYFVLPYSMVEPIKEQLELGASRPDDEIDPNWIASLKEELMEVELLITSAMAQGKSTLGTVFSWQVGDFIPMEMKEVVTMDVEGTPGFTATLGTANDKRALKIIKHISY
ncbi:MAG: flagellar motor switch protein FliM [Legionella sp.]|uniref:flagellar motor switch protein FliM n=1 Tax=Legionella sp. TaxID=459 RepID=UPI0039E2C0D7